MIKLFQNWYKRHFSQPGTIEFALVLLGSFIVVYYFMWLVGPIVVALCLSYCLDWGVRALMKHFKLSRFISSTIAMTLFVGFAVGILVFIAPKILQQGNQFYQSLQSISVSTQSSVEKTENDDFDSTVSARLYEFIEPLPDPIPSMVTEDDVKQLVSSFRGVVLANTTNIIKNQIMPSVVNAMSWLVYLIVVPIFMFLMLANKVQLQLRFRKYILPNDQTLIHDFWPKINKQIEGYIKGKLCHILIITIVNTSAFLLLGVNYAFLLGFAVGLSVVIPYVGAFIVTIPIILISVFSFGFSTHFLIICIVYLIIQLLDSNVLTPLLFSKALNLDAFSILTAIMVFGGLWGFWGVFFSIPLATFISTLITNWPDSSKEEVLKIEQKTK